MPVLRYRTRDLTSMVRERCACGRTTARIDWFTGRVDDMLVIRGVNVFPSAIEEVLLRFPELSPNYRIFVDRPPNGLDQMLVEVEHHPDTALDLEQLTGAVNARLSETLLVSLQTRIVRPGTIERIEAGKAKRVIDRRNTR
jgi:phenylacetate-CoA ligase